VQVVVVQADPLTVLADRVVRTVLVVLVVEEPVHPVAQVHKD
jgi:hypothetical protein